jgi:hypothetical protein
MQKWIKYTFSHQQEYRLKINFNNHGSKFVSTHIECETYYVHVIAEKLYNKVCLLFDSN